MTFHYFVTLRVTVDLAPWALAGTLYGKWSAGTSTTELGNGDDSLHWLVWALDCGY